MLFSPVSQLDITALGLVQRWRCCSCLFWSILRIPDSTSVHLQMVLETKSGLEGAVIGGGHSVAASRLDAQRSVAGWVSEQMGGLSYLFYIRDLVRGFTIL